MSDTEQVYGETVAWHPERPKLRPLRLALALVVSAASIWVAAAILPGVGLGPIGSAFIAAIVIGVLNAVLPPVIAALRLPYAFLSGFLAVLLADALILQAASQISPNHIQVSTLGSAFVAALIVAIVSLVLQVILGISDDDEYNLRVTRRIAM